jgi:hypothetical protein
VVLILLLLERFILLRVGFRLLPLLVEVGLVELVVVMLVVEAQEADETYYYSSSY